MRCRAFYRVSFWVVLIKFVKAVLSLATARMSPTDLKKLGCEKLWWSTYQIAMVIFTRYPSKLSGYQMSIVHLTVLNKTVVIQ